MANFDFTAHEIDEGPPVYNTVITKMEGLRRKARVKSSEPDRTFKLKFNGQTDTEKNAIKAHYDSQYGDGDPFYWTTVPSDIDSGTNIYVRYKSISFDKIMNNIHEISIEFQEEIIP